MIVWLLAAWAVLVEIIAWLDRWRG